MIDDEAEQTTDRPRRPAAGERGAAGPHLQAERRRASHQRQPRPRHRPARDRRERPRRDRSPVRLHHDHRRQGRGRDFVTSGITAEEHRRLAAWSDGRQLSWGEGLLDVDVAVPMVEEAQALYPGLRACSFDRGFHSPANRVRLDALLDANARRAAAIFRRRTGSGNRRSGSCRRGVCIRLSSRRSTDWNIGGSAASAATERSGARAAASLASPRCPRRGSAPARGRSG